jgi:hypothetical protein
MVVVVAAPEGAGAAAGAAVVVVRLAQPAVIRASPTMQIVSMRMRFTFFAGNRSNAAVAAGVPPSGVSAG